MEEIDADDQKQQRSQPEYETRGSAVRSTMIRAVSYLQFLGL